MIKNYLIGTVLAFSVSAFCAGCSSQSADSQVEENDQVKVTEQVEETEQMKEAAQEEVTDREELTDHKVYIESGETVTGVADYSNSEIETADNLAIPGYESLEFRAGTKVQNVEFDNPADNTCYFVMTLSLEDGTEIWKSDYLEPGVMYDCIVLNKELEAGEYENASLVYDCYALADKHELNGANISLTLNVR